MNAQIKPMSSPSSRGSGAVVALDDPATRLLLAWAKQLSVQPVLQRGDLDGHPEPLKDRNWCADRKIIPLRDGRLLASARDYVSTGRDVLRSENAAKIVVLPTAHEVFQTLLDELFQNESADALSDIEKSDIEYKISDLIERAVTLDVTDIHIEVRPQQTLVRVRDRGTLRVLETMSPRAGINLVKVMFNVAADNAKGGVYNPREPADGTIEHRMGDSHVRVRLASMPAHPGESVDVVMRVLSGDRKVSGLAALGYSELHTRLITGALSRPHGIILVAGPTGSGKSTTLAAMLSALPKDEKTITIEDPPEYDIKGITQVPADTGNAAKNFAAMTRATMRMDPDNIMIGEIRDEDTAQMAMRAAITGHRVFSTIHAKSATSIVTRLVDFGLNRNVLADPDLLVALMFQRLVPTVCPNCAFELKANHDAFKRRYDALYQRLLIAVEEDRSRLDGVRFTGRGCQRCGGTGVGGQTVVAEVIYVDQHGRQHIAADQVAAWESHLLSCGWPPYRQHMLEKILSGQVSPIEAERDVGSLSEATIGPAFNYTKDVNRLGG